MANDKSPGSPPGPTQGPAQGSTPEPTSGPTQGSTAQPTQQPIQEAWIHFVKSVQVLLVPQPHDRPLDQFLPFRDEVMALVLSEPFLRGLNHSWPPFHDYPNIGIDKPLLLEIEAFCRSVEVAKATAKQEEGNGWWRTMLGRASTVTGSVNDLMDNLPPVAKGGLTLFKELIDLFRGKD